MGAATHPFSVTAGLGRVTQNGLADADGVVIRLILGNRGNLTKKKGIRRGLDPSSIVYL